MPVIHGVFRVGQVIRNAARTDRPNIWSGTQTFADVNVDTLAAAVAVLTPSIGDPTTLEHVSLEPAAGTLFPQDVSLNGVRNVPFAAASITSNKNDYDDLGGRANERRWSSSGAFNVTGFMGIWNATPANLEGFTFSIRNVGGSNITLKNEDAASTAEARWHTSTGADIVLAPNKKALVNYDATLTRWYVVLLP